MRSCYFKSNKFSSNLAWRKAGRASTHLLLMRSLRETSLGLEEVGKLEKGLRKQNKTEEIARNMEIVNTMMGHKIKDARKIMRSLREKDRIRSQVW